MADLVSRLRGAADSTDLDFADPPWWWDVPERGGPAPLLREAADEIMRLTTLLAEGHGQTSTEEEPCPRCYGRGTTEAGELSGLSDYPCAPCKTTGRMLITRCVSCDSILHQEPVD
jgi:hypothetical protein